MASSLDSNAQAASQVLLGQLNYKLPPTASYVLDRASSVFLTSGAGTFSPAGASTFRIPINSDGQWADLNTLNISFTIKNRSANALAVLFPKTDGPWSLIQRMRLYVSGTVVEDLQWYGRIHESFYQLLSRSAPRPRGASCSRAVTINLSSAPESLRAGRTPSPCAPSAV